jgi:Ni,Fe-hydrogenase III large subunit/Ni,Fe-hydrogenase III component G
MNSHEIAKICAPYGHMLMSHISNHNLFRLNRAEGMPFLCQALTAQGFGLLTMVATDEGGLEDGVFKLYVVLAHASEDLFLTLETPLSDGSDHYPALSSVLPAAEPFEQEILDLMGLQADGRLRPLRPSIVRRGLADDFYPLRRDAGHPQPEDTARPSDFTPGASLTQTEGVVLVPVGPVHAGVIEPGRFHFQTYGEVVKELEIALGYTHKGIEPLMQNRFGLADGWRLAEQISGDSSFAHSLAFCRAVESLVNPSLPLSAELWRGIFLELERVANHINDSAALAQDTVMDMVSAELAVLREQVLQICANFGGHRLLRGLNRPGGIVFPNGRAAPGGSERRDLREQIQAIAAAYIDLAYLLMEHNGFRERLSGTGILTRDQATHLGMYGFVARASGLATDFRLNHPQGIYRLSEIRRILESAISGLPLLLSQFVPTGDALSRFALRAREVALSCQLIEKMLDLLDTHTLEEPLCIPLNLTAVSNYEFGFGYAEGWRGPVTAWVMKEKFNRIFRFKATDPSKMNWNGLKAAVEPHLVNLEQCVTNLADFPIINKSFNLSYSGYDL